MVMVDGEEQLFDPKHPIWKIIAILALGLLGLGGQLDSNLIGGLL